MNKKQTQLQEISALYLLYSRQIICDEIESMSENLSYIFYVYQTIIKEDSGDGLNYIAVDSGIERAGDNHGNTSSNDLRAMAEGRRTGFYEAIAAAIADTNFYIDSYKNYPDELKNKYSKDMAMLSRNAEDGVSEIPSYFEIANLPGFDESMLVDVQSGFKSQLYKNKDTGLYVYVFAGTDDATKGDDWFDPVSGLHLSWDDMSANTSQALGFGSKQHKLAVDNAREISRIVQTLGGTLNLAGHSLGGSLAATAGTILGLHTTTFNSAGVNGNTLSLYGNPGNSPLNYVVAYHMVGCILTYCQDTMIIPDAIGRRVAINNGISMPSRFAPKDSWRQEGIIRHKDLGTLGALIQW